MSTLNTPSFDFIGSSLRFFSYFLLVFVCFACWIPLETARNPQPSELELLQLLHSKDALGFPRGQLVQTAEKFCHLRFSQLNLYSAMEHLYPKPGYTK